MRTRILKTWGWLVALGLVLCTAKAVNDCIEYGPHTNAWYCLQPGTVLNPGTLSYTSTNVCVDTLFSTPVLVTDPTFTNGLESRLIWMDCDPSQDRTETKSVTYTNGPLQFVPSMPTIVTNQSTNTYSAIVTGFGTDNACSLSVTVAVVRVVGISSPPLILSQPTSLTAVVGDTVTFTVLATACPGVTYQWQFNGTNISGATGSSYGRTNVQASDMGNYRVVASNLAGSVTSANATLTVIGVDRIIVDGSNPEVQGSASIALGDQIILRAMPSPAGTNFPAGYPVWSVNGLATPPAGSATATNVPSVAGQYILWASCGTSSNNFVITVASTNDDNYDGIPDSWELAYGTNAPQMQLGSWRFDTPDWVGLEGQLPISYTNLLLLLGWYVGSVEINSNSGPAALVYAEINTNTFIANINCRNGSIRFRFKSDWNSANTNSGSGPGDEGRLIEVGSKGTTNGCWGLYFDSGGTNICFCTLTNSIGSTTALTNLTAGIRWVSNDWHEIVLTYSVSNSSFYLDGQPLATNGLGVTNWPGPVVRAQGFRIGSGDGGTNWAQGRFDNLETFNFVWSAADVATFYSSHPQPQRITNFCQLAPITINFQSAQALTNGQIVYATNTGSVSGNSGWLDWSGANGSAGDLVVMLTNLNSVTNYVNPVPGGSNVLYVEGWVFGNTGVSGTPDVYAALDAYTNSPASTNPITIGIVLWDAASGSGGNLNYQVAGFANIALISYKLNGGITDPGYIQFKYLGVRQCNSYYPNQPPTNTIVYPADMQIFTAWNTNVGAVFPITAAAYDPEDGLTNLAFYSSTNANLLGSLIYYQAITNADTNLYTFVWTNAPHGTNYLTSVASDEFGARTTSAVVRVIVNWAPVVNAGTNQTIIWPDNSTNVSLYGTAYDDGLIQSITTTWSVITSNGPVTFVNAGATNTTAQFVTNGIYVLQLTANDGVVSVSSQCTVTILNRPTISITWPTNDAVFNSGTTINITATASDADGVVTNVQFLDWTNTVLGTIPGETTVYSLAWTNAPWGTNALTAVATDNNGLRTTSAVVRVIINNPPTVCAGSNQIITLPQTNVTLNGSVGDDGLPPGAPVTISWNVINSNGPVLFGDPHSATTTASFVNGGLYTLQLSANDTLATSSSNVTITVNQAPQVNAGTNRIVTLVGSNVVVNLFGTVSDDGLPVGAPVTSAWSVVSATNGTVAISNSAAPATTAIFTNNGVYVLRLTANDTVSTSSADVTITVNCPPVVNAGTNQTLVWVEGNTNISTALAGTATDDGYPGGILTNIWSVAGGPNTVTFSPANSTNTTATFYTNGFYTLQLVASDGAARSTNTCTVFVQRRPFVFITWPTNQATFNYGETIVDMATAYDLDGVVTNVQFFDGSNLLGTATNSLTILSGCTDWWQAESNAYDSMGTNNGTLQGGTGYAPGRSGLAFLLATTNAGVKVPASPSLNVGTNNGFTLMAWVNPSTISPTHRPLFEWNVGDGVTYWGVHFWIWNDARLYANVVDSGGGWHTFWSASWLVVSNQFQHVALTYDRTSGLGTLYYNGVIVAQQSLGSFTPLTTYDLYLGKRPLTQGDTYSYAGLLDDMQIYSRALSSNEISSVYSNCLYYTFVWTNAPVGSNCLTAVATDNDGLTKTSAPVVITVTGAGPTVQITDPVTNQLFIASPLNISLAATATDSSGTVTNVQFLIGTNFLGNAAPGGSNSYSLLWANVAAGGYSLTAKATDDHGHAALSSAVAITVNAMPAVSIITPTNWQSFLEVTNVTISASATDPDGTISQVQFYYYTNFLGSVTTTNANGDYSLTFSDRHAGTYPIVAVATDNQGASNASQITVFKVNSTNVPPVVAITWPTNDAVIADGSDITITAAVTGTNSTSVTNVQFFVDGESIGNDPDPPYGITKCCWKPGTYQLTAVAIDNWGASSISSNVQITVAPESPAAEGFWDANFHPTNSRSGWPLITADECGNYVDLALCEAAGVHSSDIYLATYESTWPNNPPGGAEDENSYAVYKWDGTNWFRWGGLGDLSGTFSEPPNSFAPCHDLPFDTVGALAVNDSGLYVAGIDTNGANYIVQRWNGTNWTQLGGDFTIRTYFSTNYYVRMDQSDAVSISQPHLQFVGSDLFIYGDLTYSTNIQFIAKWNSSSSAWEPVGSALNGPVMAVSSLRGNLVVGGFFTGAGGNTNANRIAELTGGQWKNLGTGVGGVEHVTFLTNDYQTAVFSLATCNTNLFVGGDFTMAGDETNANGIAIWSGIEWKTIGGGLISSQLDDSVISIAPDQYFAWDYYLNPVVYSISTHGNSIYVAGQFTDALNPDGSDVRAASIVRVTWSEDTQRWTWSDMDGGIYNLYGDISDSVKYATSVFTTTIVNGPTLGAYDVIVGGGSTGDAMGLFFEPFYHVTRWRVGYPAPPSLPSVTITNPVNYAVIANDPANPTNVTIIAKAVSDYTNIANVYFYADGGYVSVDATPHTNSFSCVWSNPGIGPHLLTAVATDGAGLAGKSDPVIINVKNPTNTITAVDDRYIIPANSPPVILNILSNDVPATDLSVSQVTQLHYHLGIASVCYRGKYITYTPFPNVYGTDIFYYNVTNASGAVDSASVTVRIHPRPVVEIIEPGNAEQVPATNSVISLTVSGDSFEYGGLVTNIDLYVNGTKYDQTTNSDFNFTWSTSSAGIYTFRALATDADGYTNTSSPVTMLAYTVTDGVMAEIDNLGVAAVSPVSGLPMTGYPVVSNGLFDLQGQARATGPDTNIPVVYQLLLHPPSDPDTIVANVTPQADASGLHEGSDSNGDLGILDFSGIPNGVYDLELIVYGGGTSTNVTVRFILNSQLKIGQFSFSEQDLILPVNGIPITITRTYNSQNPLSGDFGYGWSFAISTMDVQLDEERQDVTVGGNNAPFADDEEGDNGLPKVVSIRTGGDRDVTLTLPNGQITTFAFTPYSGGDYATAQWTAPPWVHATLEPLGNPEIDYYPSLMWKEGGWDSDYETHDEPGWILTTLPDKTQYRITRGAINNVVYNPNGDGNFVNVQVYGTPKLTEIDQHSGDKIFITDNSIYHQNPTGGTNRTVTFDRDSAGRITAIYDPISQQSPGGQQPIVKYVYNQDTGNLIWVLKLVDRDAGTYVTNKYHYDNPHFPYFITSIENGDGVPVARNYYDDSGRLTAVQDANGNLTRFLHNLTNDMEVVVDRLGGTNTYVYDLRGNVTAQTNALGQVTTMDYDANNNKTNEVVYLNGLPYASSYVYNDKDLLLSSTDPLGHTNGFTYDDYGNVLTSADALGHTTVNTYDPDTGELISTTDALGRGTTNAYDNGLLTGSVDAVGTLSTNSYDSSGNLIGSATFAANGVTILATNSFGYDLNGNRTNSTVWRKVGASWVGTATTYICDAMNRVVQTISPDGGSNIVVYDNTGKQQATIDPLGRTNSYIYDGPGRLVQTTYPDGTAERSSYDANGNRMTSSDRAGQVTTYSYDALNRLTNTIYADLSGSATVYDGVGRMARTIDARGTVTAFAYDVAGRRVAVTNAFGSDVANTNFFGYDESGNQTLFTDALGRATTNVFDALNRQVQVLHPDGTINSTGYDAVGRRVAETNQDGIVTEFGYDGAGRLTSVTNAVGKAEQIVTRYSYDEAGNEITQIDALNRTTTFDYDNMGRRIGRTLPGTQHEGFAYDLAGNQIYHTNFNGVVITNVYDVMNRLTARVYPNGTSNTFTYTSTGQRQTMDDGSGSYTYVYDLRDRLCTNTTPAGTLTYSYDANGNVTSIASSTAGGTLLAYQYDALNRLTNVVDSRLTGAQNTTYGYDAVGNLQRRQYSNSLTNLYQYDSLNRLTNLVWKANGNPVASFAYTLGATGNRTALSEAVSTATRSYTWQYDQIYRLTNEVVSGTTPTGTLGYQYDPVGNRLNRNGSLGTLAGQTSAYNTNDWLTSTVYDSNGNTRTNGSNQPYFYDYENRLTNFNNGAVIIVYDADGNRVKKIIPPTTTTLYLVDTRNPSGYAQVLEELTVSGGTTNLARAYTYGLDLISQRQPGASTNFLVYDGHGSTRLLADKGGNVVNVFAYDAFGTVIASNAPPQTVYLYCSQQFDPDLGLYYNRARYLNTDSGRFWTMDTFAGENDEPLSLHKYLYAANNPANNFDPTGNDIVTTLAAMYTGSGIYSLPSTIGTVRRVLGIGYAGPNITQAIVDHINTFSSQIPANGSMFLYTMEQRYATVARQNGWGGPFGRAVLATRPGFNGTVTFGDMVISAYHIDHILIMSYIGICFGEETARAAGQLQESRLLGLQNAGASFATTGDPNHDDDLTFNEVAISLSRQVRPGNSSTQLVPLTVPRVLEITRSVTEAQRATIAIKPSMQLGIRGYQDYVPSNRPIPRPAGLIIPQLYH